MTALTDATRAKVKEIVCDILELETEEVTETSLFVEEHGADSMRAIEILASLEINFGVVIDQSELERMVNLAGVYEVLGDRLAGTAA
ncbi:acyl carrier protein [Spirillospora sp. NPDC000708]|uniref:acyl carrier protein n=1 Tax=Actinomadura TaxID=1988 RepID=UPI001682D21B|nr:acyl carrier protein [Actinomadura sp. RB99]MBD2892451.1 Acyl carrier protein [Actinomadura sp. RB99]